jgi:hypothetical protein
MEMRNAYNIILLGKPEGKRWENIEMDLKETGYRDVRFS